MLASGATTRGPPPAQRASPSVRAAPPERRGRRFRDLSFYSTSTVPLRAQRAREELFSVTIVSFCLRYYKNKIKYQYCTRARNRIFVQVLAFSSAPQNPAARARLPTASRAFLKPRRALHRSTTMLKPAARMFILAIAAAPVAAAFVKGRTRKSTTRVRTELACARSNSSLLAVGLTPH